MTGQAPSAPLVSVVMAAYNGAALIGETLRSLSAQTLADWEAIVVDDGSVDDTVAMLRAWPDPRVRVLTSAANAGPVAARNRAVAAARGRFVAGLDQDDLCRPERLARQVAYLDRHPGIALVGTAAAALQGARTRAMGHAPVTSPALTRWLLQIENPLVWSSVMVRADVARALAPFTRAELTYAEDFDLYHRVLRIGGIGRIDEELVLYRQHGGGMSRRAVDLMLARAGEVLAAAYAPILQDEAPAAGALVARHVMGQVPVADRAALERLGSILARLQSGFLAQGDCTAADVRLIRWETARRWARIGRAALRSGAVTLAEAMAVRPDHVGLGYAGPGELAWSRLMGSRLAGEARRAVRAARG